MPLTITTPESSISVGIPNSSTSLEVNVGVLDAASINIAAVENKISALEGDTLALEDEAGVSQLITNEVFVYDRELVVGPSWRVSLSSGDAKILATDEETGISIVLGEPNTDPTLLASGSTTSESIWTEPELDYAESRALAEALRLNSQDVTGFAKRAVDATSARVLRIGSGQSFMAGSGQARLFLSTSRLALLGLTPNPCLSVGPDSRCVNAGATYVTFGGDSLTLTPLAEHFIAQTGTDYIYTDLEVSTGDYTYNARGGTPETVRDVVSWVLRNEWNGLPATDLPDWTTVAMNHAKTDGLLSEVATGDGRLRFQSMLAKFVSATSGTRLCDVIDFNHGEANENDSGTTSASYAADLATACDDFWSDIQAAPPAGLGQTVRPVMLMQQVGGPRYGSAAMLTANAQVDLMTDLTGTEASVFLVGCKYEVPSYYFYTHGAYPGFPDDPADTDGTEIWTNNGHPTLAGNVLMGIRSAIALHYIQDREEPMWVPFPYECFYSGNRFLLSIPSKAPPLRAVDMVCGVETYLRDDLGITFENSGGSNNPVVFARVVEGYKTLIEGECASDISSFPVMKTGKRTGPLTVSGFTNIRDSFTIKLPFDLPFDRNQTIFPAETRDSPTLNGLGRWLEDIPGWVGKPDLGNPCARRTLTAIPMPGV